jgi:hypothetical protein
VYSWGLMANFFIRDRRVVRLMPNRAAAPSGLPTRPLAFGKRSHNVVALLVGC